MTVLESYEAKIQAGELVPDLAQKKSVVELDKLYQALIKQKSVLLLVKHHLERLVNKNNPVKGLYLWGGVGRGKTLLMDLFYHALPFEQKTRLHFHRFMQWVHQSLKRYQGVANPLSKIAKEFSQKNRVLCFDEFFVSDITDAMILAELLSGLFSQGVILVATSNIQPENLYPNGLQRERFLPAIDLIYQHTQVIHLDTPKDYRLQYLTQAQIYHYPLDALAEENLATYFAKLSPEKGIPNKKLMINHRALITKRCADSIVWFDFEILCDSPRSAQDYIEIAKYFHTVLISGVKIMGENKEDCAKRFVNMIDAFYDCNVTIIFSGELPLEKLYQGKRLIFEFQRTLSRLIEMQSTEYLAKPHLG